MNRTEPELSDAQLAELYADPLLSARDPLRTPKGMGDLLPPEADARRALTRVVLRSFELWGYDLIVTPLFEHAEVVERGTDALDPRDLLRFVEPESGEVAVLRPDITPQVARVIATRMAKHPAPWRLCYEGRVIRRRRGRARSHQQLTQAGFECVGLRGPEADIETISLAHAACLAAGLPHVRIELSHVSIAQSLLERLPQVLRSRVAELLARKDGSALARLIDEVRLPSEIGERLLSLVEHYGDLEVLRTAAKGLRWPAATAALRNLRDIVERLEAAGLGGQLGLDLSDARGSTYYSGVSFNLLAEGPGEPIGAGGRYDQLLGRYGMDQPATGFAFDLENLQWALRHAGNAHHIGQAGLRIVAAAGGNPSRLAQWVGALRAHDVVVAVLPELSERAACLAFARAWRYDAVLLPGGSGKLRDAARAQEWGALLVRAADGSEKTVSRGDLAGIDALERWAQGRRD
ncbi:MAG TPA: ATP phosphoribosyltransferase regulatory subunit [Polyangiales bacterium]|nr:ATP phosphoribosyltransferase regulatory subunit [Polyangiales bacterium]